MKNMIDTKHKIFVDLHEEVHRLLASANLSSVPYVEPTVEEEALKVKIDQKLLSLISSAECKVEPDSVIAKRMPWAWYEGVVAGAYGMFCHKAPNMVFIFDICPQSDVNYVTAHEFMHFISYNLQLGMHKLIREEQYTNVVMNYTQLSLEEEYRADMSAIKLMNMLELGEAPSWVLGKRISRYMRDISEARRAELDLDITMILKKVIDRFRLR